MKIGIIAEDDSDVVVMRELTLSSLKPHNVGFKRFVGEGCGKLRRKCRIWAEILVKQGCSWVIVVHDLDSFTEKNLRDELVDSIATSGALATVVLIPRREIEAWLLYDGMAIARAFKESRPPRLPPNPETLRDPKRHLEQLVARTYRKQYLNTRHNGLIAREVSLSHLAHSVSFRLHPPFAALVRAKLSKRRA